MIFVGLSYSFIILFYMMKQITNINMHKLDDISLCASILVLSLYYIKGKIQLFPNKKAIEILGYLLLIFVVFQFLNINEFYYKETQTNCIENLLVIINIYMISRYIVYKRAEDKFVFIAYLVISMFISGIYCYNFDNFQGLKQIALVFDNTNRYRSGYGLLHPNATGMICYIALLLAFYLYNCPVYKNNFFKALMFGFNMVTLIVLISTASRTAITALVLFLMVFYFMKIKNKLNINSKVSVFIIHLIIIIGIVLSINIISKIQGDGFAQFVAETNRSENYTVDIPILFINHKELFGIGYFSALPELYGGTDYLDNWYLYMLITSGIIGLILSILLVIKTYYYVLRNNKKSLLEIFTISYFISQLYYSIFETQFFSAGFLNTFIFWIFIFMTIYYKNNRRIQVIC